MFKKYIGILIQTATVPFIWKQCMQIECVHCFYFIFSKKKYIKKYRSFTHFFNFFKHPEEIPSKDPWQLILCPVSSQEFLDYGRVFWHIF